MVEGVCFTLPRPLYATLNLGKGEKKAQKTATEKNRRETFIFLFHSIFPSAHVSQDIRKSRKYEDSILLNTSSIWSIIYREQFASVSTLQPVVRFAK